MEKIIAVPVDQVSVLDAHFGHCKFFLFFTINDHTIVSEERLIPPPHEPGVIPKWVAEKGATDIIAGGMGQKAIQIFNEHGVNAFVGAPQIPARDVVRQYLDGKLSLSANYCTH